MISVHPNELPSAIQSRNKKAVRLVLSEIMIANPNASDYDLIKLYADEIRDDEESRFMAAQYLVILQLNHMRRTPPRPSKSIEDALIKGKFRLLSLIMPNGKAMSDCTGAEMISFGGYYTRIGQKVGAKRLVGTLTEDQVKGLMK